MKRTLLLVKNGRIFQLLQMKHGNTPDAQRLLDIMFYNDKNNIHYIQMADDVIEIIHCGTDLEKVLAKHTIIDFCDYLISKGCTMKEIAIMKYYFEGNSKQQVADLLILPLKTLGNQLTVIFFKCGEPDMISLLKNWNGLPLILPIMQDSWFQ
jgi:hypothetical protein